MSSVYADVIVDITNEKLDRTFQYKVPPELTGEIGPGTAVQIPFGNGNRTITGYVLSVGNEPKYPQDRMKAILAVQKDAATVETKLIALAAWMRHTYGSTMIQALKTVLPVKVKARGKETREIALLADPAECEELLENYRKKNYKARIRLLNALLAQPVLPGPVVSKELKITADTLHVMEEQGVLEIRRTSTWRNPVSDAAGRTTAGKPNEQQQAVVDGIRKEWEVAEPPLPDPRCDGKRQNARLYGADGASAGRKTGDRADPGDCADVSERGAVLRTVWNKGHGGQLADDTVRARRPDGARAARGGQYYDRSAFRTLCTVSGSGADRNR